MQVGTPKHICLSAVRGQHYLGGGQNLDRNSLTNSMCFSCLTISQALDMFYCF